MCTYPTRKWSGQHKGPVLSANRPLKYYHEPGDIFLPAGRLNFPKGRWHIDKRERRPYLGLVGDCFH